MKCPPNEGDFVGLYAQHQGQLFRYVAAIVPHLQDAEDVLGEVTVALWKNFPQFEPGTSFLAWARRIAYLRVLEYYRARDRRLVLPPQLLDRLATQAESREALADRRLAYLDECKEELAAQDRQLLEERYADNVKVQDLATRLGRTENSISKSLGRIRRGLLDCIQRKMAAEERVG
jgi:RNA polymerase sigma-70 factor, ECF subfamily